MNLAIHLLRDARENEMDVAYVVTGDSDIAPAARMLRADFPNVKLISVNTPGRPHSKEILMAADGAKASVSAAVVESCLMPYEMTAKDGSLTICPATYRR